jgi:cytidylate kinase
MNATSGLEKCVTFINCQLQPPTKVAALRKHASRIRAVTLSRQTGSGGHSVATRLAEYLESRAPAEHCAWTVFDRNIVEQVLEDHHLPKRLAQFMPEDRISEMADTMDELFGLHPPSWTLVRQTSETILRLAELGNVILLGRGANIITRSLDYVFHVRLVGSVEKRAQFLQNRDGMTRAAALNLIRREDRGRQRYVRKYFDQDIDDPMLYHMVINTDLVAREELTAIIGEAVLNHEHPAVNTKR